MVELRRAGRTNAWQSCEMRAFASLICGCIGATCLAVTSSISAPLLHVYETVPLGSVTSKSSATDRTNCLVALRSEYDGSISAQLVAPDASLVGAFQTGRIGTVPYTAFNGTSYLLAWTESAGTS